MKEHLTVVYLTNRPEPRFEWFASSLARSLVGDPTGIRLVIVDAHADLPGRRADFKALAPFGIEVVYVPPKPCVWQGPQRLTSQDYYAASNARNTGLCLAPDGWLAYADDLSVLTPGWLPAVRQAMATGRFTLGAYRKVRKLTVASDGQIVSFAPCDSNPASPAGWDSRYKHGSDDGPIPAYDSWFFGCSMVGPVEAFLSFNGFEEDCDGMGFEDCITGLYAARAGVKTWYDRRMFTLEDEDLHFQPGGCVLPRFNAVYPPGGPDQDACWRILREARSGIRQRSTTYPEPLADIRRRVLAGEPFPSAMAPTISWQDGRPLSEF